MNYLSLFGRSFLLNKKRRWPGNMIWLASLKYLRFNKSVNLNKNPLWMSLPWARVCPIFFSEYFLHELHKIDVFEAILHSNHKSFLNPIQLVLIQLYSFFTWRCLAETSTGFLLLVLFQILLALDITLNCLAYPSYLVLLLFFVV